MSTVLDGRTVVAAEARVPAPAAVAEAAAAPRWIWGMLIARSVLAVGLQAAVAVVALLAGAADPWRVSADWWLGSFTIANAVTLVLLRHALAREGRRLRDLFRVRRANFRGDLPWLVAALVVSGPIAMLPNVLLGGVLWGSSEVGAELSFRAIPVVAAVAICLIFPIVHGAAELPTYFGYVMPRLNARYGWGWAGLAVAAIALSSQHMFLPLLFDWRFLAWRGLMFLGFAFWVGFVIYRRPTTLPYLAVAHAILDASLPLLVLQASL